VVCEGTCRHKSAEECVAATHLVFPYRGAYVQHTGRPEAVAEPNQIVFINEDEAYRVSHPVEGGDASLSIQLDTPTLLELASADYLQVKGRPAFNRSRLHLDAHVQVLTALVRHRLSRGMIETLEAESLALEAVGDDRYRHIASLSLSRLIRSLRARFYNRWRKAARKARRRAPAEYISLIFY
jgi:AraC family transcriptional regulator